MAACMPMQKTRLDGAEMVDASQYFGLSRGCDHGLFLPPLWLHQPQSGVVAHGERGWLVAVIGLEILHRSIADDLLIEGETILAVVLFRLLQVVLRTIDTDRQAYLRI